MPNIGRDQILGLCPRPQDFRRHISGVRWPTMKTASDNNCRQRPDAPSAHRRPGYPSSGCVPAEPDSVSPGNHTLASMSTALPARTHRTPEPCIKNPIIPRSGREADQKQAEKSQNHPLDLEKTQEIVLHTRVSLQKQPQRRCGPERGFLARTKRCRLSAQFTKSQIRLVTKTHVERKPGVKPNVIGDKESPQRLSQVVLSRGVLPHAGQPAQHKISSRVPCELP